MKKFFKWLGIVLGALLGFLAILLVVFYFKGKALAGKAYDITPENITIPTDEASIARGKHFVQATCTGCHSADLSGELLLDAPFSKVYSANLTPGKGGAGSKFTNADWVRAIRHGVDDQGRDLVAMPAQTFWNFNDQDLGDIIAYLKTLPSIDKENPDPQINALGTIMFGAGLFGPDIIAANVIAHNQRPPVIPIGVTAEYGGYLVSVSGCHDCHGPQLAGGKVKSPERSMGPISRPAAISKYGHPQISSRPFVLALTPQDTVSTRTRCRGKISTPATPMTN